MSGGFASTDVIEKEEGEGGRSNLDRETGAARPPPLRLAWLLSSPAPAILT